MDGINGIALRGICSMYFESHVSPLVRSLQEVQDNFKEQLQEALAEQGQLKAQISGLRGDVERKANSEDVAAPLSGRSGNPDSVATRVKLQELTASLKKKADITDVPTIAHMHKAIASIDQKLTAKEVALSAQIAELAQAVQSQVQQATQVSDEQVSPQRVEELAAALALKANAAEVPTHDHMRVVCAELLSTRAAVEQGDTGSAGDRRASTGSIGSIASEASEAKADVRKVQLVIAAAAAQFDRQLKEVKHQIRELRQHTLAGVKEAPSTPRLGVAMPQSHQSSPDTRWPGRSFQRTASDAVSNIESETGSYAPSLDACSVASAGLSAEERAELQKIRAVVGAAGTAFSRDMRDVRGLVRDLRTEVQVVKEHLRL